MGEWCQIKNHTWIFGFKIRGIIRDVKAKVHRIAKNSWVWEIRNGLDGNGIEKEFLTAVYQVERQLGLL